MILFKDIDKLFIILLFLSSQTQEATYIGAFDFSDFIIGIFITLWFLNCFINPEKKNIISPLTLIPLIFLFIQLIHVALNLSSFITLFFPIKWFITVFMLINVINTPQNVFFAIKSYIWITFLTSIVAILQFVLYISDGIILLRNQSHEVMRLRFEDTFLGPVLRSSGFFEYIHGYAIVGTIALWILLYLFLSTNYKIVGKKTGLLMIGTIMLGLMVTFYKGVYVVLFSSMIFTFYWMKPSKTIHITAGLATVLLIAYFTGILGKTLDIVWEQITMGDLAARIKLDSMGLQGFLINPLLGVGLFEARLYTADVFKLPPHNALILMADEMGLFGLVVLLFMYVYLLFRLILKSLVCVDRDVKVILKALTVTFIGFLLYAQLEPIAYNFWCWTYFGLLEGIMCQLSTEQRCINSADVQLRT